MRWDGETPMPRPKVVESGRNVKVPSRDSGREIPCRVFVPETGTPKAVFYHIHGGGWVLQSEHYQDLMLNWFAQNCQATVVSVGYRLAPEDPYPAGNDDCEDVGAWLIDHAQVRCSSGVHGRRFCRRPPQCRDMLPPTEVEAFVRFQGSCAELWLLRPGWLHAAHASLRYAADSDQGYNVTVHTSSFCQVARAI
jgi:hypothetical protein